MNFGVFYTCFTEKKAVDYSLEVLKSIYPDVKIYLVSDGGSSFDDLKVKYKNLETKLEEDTRSFIPFLKDESDYKNSEIQNKIKNSILRFLERVSNAIDFCNEEYLLIMEPDVLVRGKLTNPENKIFLGSRINSGLSDELKYVLSNTDDAIVINNWGATPAIFRCDEFKKAHKKLLSDENLLNSICLSENRLANYDILLAVLFALIGVEESFNPEIVECFRNPNWENSNHPLVHQFRAKYPTSEEGYNGTHITNKNGLGDNWYWKR